MDNCEKQYLVVWECHIDAASPREAARKALQIQRDPTSVATIFSVFEGDQSASVLTEKQQVKATYVDLWLD